MSQEKPKKHRWLLWATIFSVFIFLISPFMLYRLRNRAEFNRKVRELAAAGYPVSFDDLEAAYVLPDGVENAADVYLKAFAIYTEPNKAEGELLPCRGDYIRLEDQPPYPQEVMDAVKSSLDKNRAYLALLDQAARMEHCMFPRTRTEWGFDFEHLNPLKKAAQILTEQNLYLAQIGQTDALFESTQTCIGLTNSLNQQPQLIDNLVIIAIKAIVAASIEDSLNLTDFSNEQLIALQQQCRRMRENNMFALSPITERARQIQTVRLSAKDILEYFNYVSPFIPEKALFMLYSFSGLMDKDFVLLLGFHERWIESSKLSFHDQFIELEKLEQELESYNPSLHYGLHLWAPSCHVGKINLRVMGQLQCAETALAIERYRLKNQTLPKSLEALVPEFIDTVYLDPFDGKPLRYLLRKDGGYTVYQIGEDGIDNGGLDRERMSKKTGTKRATEYDYPFTVKH